MSAPPASDLRVANEHIDDRDMLTRLLADEGYLFFRDVLDAAAALAAGAEMMAVLERRGLVELHDGRPVSTARFVDGGIQDGKRFGLDEEFEKRQIWQRFVALPSNRGFFEKIAGGPVGFAPIAYYRCRPPGWGEYWHQDGFYMQGFGLRTAWIPVMPISRELGGICIAAGMHRFGFLQDAARWEQPIPEERIAPESRRCSEYFPGDVLIFDNAMPHTGLSNTSPDNVCRLSFDVRFCAAERRSYLDGDVVDAGDDWIQVAGDDGLTRRLDVSKETLLTEESGATEQGSELSAWLVTHRGRVMVTHDADRATYVRHVAGG
jgi:1-deoxypentalenic acid 11beta-hydroxylase